MIISVIIVVINSTFITVFYIYIYTEIAFKNNMLFIVIYFNNFSCLKPNGTSSRGHQAQRPPFFAHIWQTPSASTKRLRTLQSNNI